MASVSNVEVSKPINNAQSVDVSMNGFAWDSNGGLFIPTDQPEVILNPPQPKIYG